MVILLKAIQIENDPILLILSSDHLIKNTTSSFMLIKNVVDIERTIEIKKTSLTLFLKIDEIDKSEPHR